MDLRKVELGFGVEERFVADFVGLDFDEAVRGDVAAEMEDAEGRGRIGRKSAEVSGDAGSWGFAHE